MSAAVVPPVPYVPRRFQRLGLWAAGELTLKAYGITWRTDQPGPPSPLVRSARDTWLIVSPAMPKPKATTGWGLPSCTRGEKAAGC